MNVTLPAALPRAGRAPGAPKPSTAGPAGHEWRSCTLCQALRCPRQWKLQHVDGLAAAAHLTGYAGPIGDALHAGAALILQRSNAGQAPPRDELADVATRAFCEALAEDQKAGAVHDPETVAAAMDRLDQRVDWLVRLAADPRVRAVEWQGIEYPVGPWQDQHGRTYTGTIDAWGVVRRDGARRWARDGREWRDLKPSEVVIVDWKTGEDLDLGWAARALHVQLGYYALALRREGIEVDRAFLGALADLHVTGEKGKPRDEHGNSIPRWLPSRLNPAYVAAFDVVRPGADPLSQERVDRAAASKARPKDEAGNRIEKWLADEENPEWRRRVSEPRGALFHECALDLPVIATTVAAAIRGVEAGLFPATGAATGECGRCAWARHCTGQSFLRPPEEKA